MSDTPPTNVFEWCWEHTQAGGVARDATTGDRFPYLPVGPTGGTR